MRSYTKSGPTIRYLQILRKDPCVYCLRFTENPTVDHIEPCQWETRKIEGTTVMPHGVSIKSWPNLTAACKECNSRKDHTSLLLYLVENPLHL